MKKKKRKYLDWVNEKRFKTYFRLQNSGKLLIQISKH